MRRTRSPRSGGFTLIELLTVIAIIGILVAILIPAIGAAQTAVKRATSRARFGDWIRAISLYDAQYGYYPNLGSGQSGSSDSKYELKSETITENFIRALSGKNSDRSDLSSSERKAYNRQAIEFCSFPSECFQDNDPTKKKLVDAFDNPNIRVLLDTDRTGDVKMEDAGKLADTSELGLLSENKVNAKIIIYTLKADGAGYQDIVAKQ